MNSQAVRSRTYELVGGPLDGDQIALHEGSRFRLYLQPAGVAAATAADEDRIQPRHGDYELRPVGDDFALVWQGEK